MWSKEVKHSDQKCLVVSYLLFVSYFAILVYFDIIY